MTKKKSLTSFQKRDLLDAQLWCDENDKSTEFMIQFMSDYANVEYEDVIEFITNEED